ncbi:F0F1 ATP synthase subunit B [Nocardia farcinica]|uniref:ATP synthase subunit b n=2 Tax=Nocardia farcinica TaxID=37329 RepID=ATPF_NOCFA|nr:MULTISPECIES: F0F1 ATP synthase subunit B [Nocardia]Q5Z0Y5.1 RecName: Full=ATP synthase subunit b; AltName: Full=ATP synthase F(0) sector subunit b; AltName: Full=ATPase subunit I; AltName: Full=F-type ATPase subunit b; Short=F-ATPase subunit b [Nocardia farcinica IFM 10152]AXK86200.1 F0F1 ATP synthase subunit B [Nocardia farcinica]MBA4857323.1 F0F1 ATP synthase subunit B [Nocardia farcinica]MBC9817617.1 F0F1 ATP synthase subunit B [Nocardia farcinica]MBF6069643.1 F0F1 ATP synthase subunit 
MYEYSVLAAESGEDVNPLIPATYDIVWSVVCVAIIAVVFYKYVIPRLTKVLNERADKIEGGIAKAEAAQAEAQQTLEQYQQQLADARLEAARIREDARTQGQQILAQMRAEAQAESDRIVAAGHAQLEAQRQQILTELRSEVGRTAVDLAEKIIGQSVSDEAKQAASIERFLSELDSSDAGIGVGR